MHFASLVNGHWYLYEKIPGGSRKYIGRIRENGVCPGKHREPCQVESSVTPMVAASLSAVVFEYGFSRAILELCPDSWKKLVGARWKDVLIEIIVGRSPHSYLKKDRTDTQIRVHTGNHRRSLQKSIGISLDELWNMLGNISWIQGDNMNHISSLDHNQTAFCQEHHISSLEVIS